MKINKKKFTIIIILLVILALIPPVMIIKEVVYWKALANDTENKLNQISITELENKLITELENSSLNVDNSLFTTEFEVCRTGVYDTETGSLSAYYDLDYSNNPYDGCLLACITENKESPEQVYIPLYKIEGKSENSNNVFNIKYTTGLSPIYDDYEIADIISRILREQYNVNSNSIESVKYFKDKYISFPLEGAHTSLKKAPDIAYSDYEFLEEVAFELLNNDDYIFSEIETENILNDLEFYFWSWK